MASEAELYEQWLAVPLGSQVSYLQPDRLMRRTMTRSTVYRVGPGGTRPVILLVGEPKAVDVSRCTLVQR